MQGPPPSAPTPPRSSPALVALLQATAGSTSGAFAAFCLHPLELVKIRILTGRSRKSLAGTLLHILQAEGPLVLYQGVSAQMGKESVENFVFFYVYSAITRWVKQWRGITTGVNLLVGYIAGIVTMSCVMPWEVLSTRMMLSKGKGESPLQVLRRVLREEGVGAFFHGIFFNVILCANPAIQNTVFDRIKARILRSKGSALPGGAVVSLSPWEAFLLGAFAKASALSLCYPLVRFKVEAQAPKKDFEEERPSSLLMWIKRYYRGLGAALVKSVASAALTYSMKERIARLVAGAFTALIMKQKQTALAA